MQKSNWQPSADLSILRKRANITAKIREFFRARHVLEIETPLLCHHSVTDPFIESIPAQVKIGQEDIVMYLQTSPEYAMKRLLAAGSGAIYQMSKAFRQGENGRYHNPEFSMLEWYRPDFSYHQLMDEVAALLQCVLDIKTVEKISYQALFLRYLNINPHVISLPDIMALLKKHHIDLQTTVNEVDTGLQLLLTHLIEPNLGHENPVFIYDFPASQAALAKINDDHLAERFEVYFKGIELANGFQELLNVNEQRTRFLANQTKRKMLNLPAMSIDENFLAALQQGLPACAGVALGLDRLMMLATGSEQIDQVISFGISKA